MKTFIVCLIVAGLFGCKKPDKNDEAQTSSVESSPIIGTWETTFLNAKLFEDGKLYIDTTILPPYTNMVDILEYMRFSDDSVYAKISNETGWFTICKYRISGNIILGIEDMQSDTLFQVDKLTTSEFDFTFKEIKNPSPDSIRREVIYKYKTKKQ